MAALCGRALAPDAAQTMRGLIDKMRQHLQAGGNGAVIAIYAPDNDGEVEIEAGLRSQAPYTGDGPLHNVTTPAGVAAYTEFSGGPPEVTAAHNAVQAWCKEQHKDVTGMNWEIYEQWSPDGQGLRGAVYYLLR